ncbi:guanine deaminase [Marinobacterium maritimum]|uniref:Guanine deaminase n=1 Tax=Marinobacterium maritimum TaxID=500162 RepID=A0ABP3T7H3_9GAMM
MESANTSRVLRGSILHCLDDPTTAGEAAIHYVADGLLWIQDGRIKHVGEACDLKQQLPAGQVIEDRRGCLLIPGLIDTHTHYPQLSVAASPAGTLFDWLEQRAFPAEAALEQPGMAEVLAHRFIAEMLRNGTTTAMVFAGVQPESADALFQHAQHLGLRMIAGKVLQDRLVPDALRESPEQAQEETDRLIQRWHGRDRLAYALTPRFAPACSEALLALCRDWLRQSPSLYLQTHLAETREECERVAQEFPRYKGYLDLYDQFGFLRPGSVFAHAIHLNSDEQQRLGESGAAVAHCPSSNLLLGSGLMPLKALQQAGVPLSVGTDVGAGPSCSVLKTLADALRVQQLRGEPLGVLQAFYLATLGGARALRLEQEIGSFRQGIEADFLVLDLEATPELAERTARADSLEEMISLLILLGDDRLIAETNIQGRRVTPVGPVVYGQEA